MSSGQVGAGQEDGARLARHAHRLDLLYRHLASAALRARFEPEDAVQEVFLRALAARSRWPPAEDGDDRELARWLATLCRHVVVDLARHVRAARRDGRPLPLGGSSVGGALRASALASPGPGPATRVAWGEEHARLRAAFERLAPEHRRVLGLRQFEELSAREAASRMGRSETAIHSLYRRALLAWEEEAGA